MNHDLGEQLEQQVVAVERELTRRQKRAGRDARIEALEREVRDLRELTQVLTYAVVSLRAEVACCG